MSPIIQSSEPATVSPIKSYTYVKVRGVGSWRAQTCANRNNRRTCRSWSTLTVAVLCFPLSSWWWWRLFASSSPSTFTWDGIDWEFLFGRDKDESCILSETSIEGIEGIEDTVQTEPSREEVVWVLLWLLSREEDIRTHNPESSVDSWICDGTSYKRGVC